MTNCVLLRKWVSEISDTQDSETQDYKSWERQDYRLYTIWHKTNKTNKATGQTRYALESLESQLSNHDKLSLWELKKNAFNFKWLFLRSLPLLLRFFLIKNKHTKKHQVFILHKILKVCKTSHCTESCIQWWKV